MKKSVKQDQAFHIRKKVAGGATGAVLGAVVAGPVGALVGGVLGTVVGRAAENGLAPTAIKRGNVPVRKNSGTSSAPKAPPTSRKTAPAMKKPKRTAKPSRSPARTKSSSRRTAPKTRP